MKTEYRITFQEWAVYELSVEATNEEQAIALAQARILQDGVTIARLRENGTEAWEVYCTVE